MMRTTLENSIAQALSKLGISEAAFTLEHPTDLSLGDYATNAALVAAQALKKNPREVAEEIAKNLRAQGLESVSSISVAGPGFINISLSREFFTHSLERVLKETGNFGRSSYLEGKKIIVEYTDPNPFKEFHIGHLMPNVIGESLARLFEWGGAEVKRASYQGDVGLHVACALWGIMKGELPNEEASLKTKVEFLGRSYATGATAYKENTDVQSEIREINKKVFERSDSALNKLYDMGRQWSLDYFETLYERLGTKFDFYFFESEAAPRGRELVRQNIHTGIFEESEGAIVFRGEKYGLHTRVFINKDGLPTYEAKELALAFMKQEVFPYDLSYVVTANEISEYFKVLLAALAQIAPDLAQKTIHKPHGVLRLPTGKMSSRTGAIVSAEALIGDVADVIRSKMKNEALEKDLKEEIIEDVALGAVKFTLLRQAIGKDIIFDFDKSLSFEGDSGPYLQYTVVRARSVLEKAEQLSLRASTDTPEEDVPTIERLLFRFEEVVEESARNEAPHSLVTYLLELAGAFNTYYAHTKIVGDTGESSYRIALTEGVATVIANGLSILGIKVPKAM